MKKFLSFIVGVVLLISVSIGNTASLLPYPKFHGQTFSGAALAGGKLYTYAPGTTTPKASYTTAGATVPNTNPVILNSNGDAVVYLDGLYDLVFKNSAGVTQWSLSSVSGIDAYKQTYEVDALNDYGGGTSFTQVTIEAALTAIGTTNKVTLLLLPGNWLILTALTFPANVTLNMPAGAYFSGAAVTAGTITIAGPMNEIPAIWFGFGSSSTAAVNKAAIIAAYSSIVHGVVKLPMGAFAVAADIKPTGKEGVTIEGTSSGYGYGSLNVPGTVLNFGVGTYGFDLDGSSASGAVTISTFGLKNLYINGQGQISYGIAFQGFHIFEDLAVTGCTVAGIWGKDWINSTIIDRVASSSNLGYGILMEGTYSTVYSVNNSNFRANLLAGIRITGGGGVWTQIVSESNFGAGLEIYRPDTAGFGGIFNQFAIEGNQRTAPAGAYNVTIESQTHDIIHAPNHLIFNQIGVSPLATGYGIKINDAYFMRFDDGGVSGTGDLAHQVDITSSNASMVNFINFAATVNGLSVGNRCYLTNSDVSNFGGPKFSGGVEAITGVFTQLRLGKAKMSTGTLTSGVTGAGATTIFTLAEDLGIVWVTGTGGGSIFLDCVSFLGGGTPVVISATTLAGTPAARTYTVTATALKLVMTTGTYDIRTIPFESII